MPNCDVIKRFGTPSQYYCSSVTGLLYQLFRFLAAHRVQSMFLSSIGVVLTTLFGYLPNSLMQYLMLENLFSDLARFETMQVMSAHTKYLTLQGNRVGILVLDYR